MCDQPSKEKREANLRAAIVLFFCIAGGLLLCFLASAHAATLFPHQDSNLIGVPDSPAAEKASTQREFQAVYDVKADRSTTPKIFISAGAPSFIPSKIGDIDVSTTTGKVYISTATATSGSWAVLN